MPDPTKPRRSSDYKRLIRHANLQLAWERLERAREPAYKWYWRPSLAVGNKAKTKIISRVARQLANNSFVADHVCIYSEPKPSTLLRHRSLLTIGDLLVYQAVANIVADKVYPNVNHLYGTNVFGNLYAGPGNKFFLQKWESSYEAFTAANIKAHSLGKNWLAQFDFASFYDSIGHGTLRARLEEYGVGADVCKFLCDDLLPRWSAASEMHPKLQRLVLDSGIPQGPLASPILGEVMLSYLDAEMVKLPGITYLRYADDIRIWAADEADARYAAAVLDRIARNIGIFPQANKVGFQKVDDDDLQKIIKSVSVPSDIAEPDDLLFDQIESNIKDDPITAVVWKLLDTFDRELHIEDVTNFKFMLAVCEGTTQIAERLVMVIRHCHTWGSHAVLILSE